jgi:putative transposase
MQKTFRYRIYPTRKQKQILESTLVICRLLYNSCLLDRKRHYEETNSASAKGLSYTYTYTQQADILAKDKDFHPSLKDVHSQVLQDVLKRVDRAYKNFFRRLKEKNGKNGKAGYPRLKGENRYDSFTYPQQPGFQLTPDGLKLSKIGTVRIKQHRSINSINSINGNRVIKTCTIKRDIDRWYACFAVEIPDKPKLLPKQLKTAAGIDVGLNSFAALSDGVTFVSIDNPRHLKNSEKRLAFIQRRHSKKTKNSKNRKKRQLKVAKFHRKVREQRQDFHHKVSRAIVDKYDLIAIEKLNVKGMVCNHHLSKSISDAAWGQFLGFIIYKAAEAGKWCIEVAPNGTSQICSGCGSVIAKDLSVRVHNCFVCGLNLNRDHNAAVNILHDALKSVLANAIYQTTVGTTESHAWGGKGLLFPTNQEAPTVRSG